METETIDLHLTPEALYYFKGIRGKPTDQGKPTWAYRPGWYRYKGVAKDYRTLQEKIVYVGEGGRDRGKWYLAGLADWARDMLGPYTDEEVIGNADTSKADQTDGTVPS